MRHKQQNKVFVQCNKLGFTIYISGNFFSKGALGKGQVALLALPLYRKALLIKKALPIKKFLQAHVFAVKSHIRVPHLSQVSIDLPKAIRRA